MKLLAATNRYYLLLATVLFTVGSVLLYYGVRWTLQSEVEERLFQQRDYLRAQVQRTGRLPGTPFEGRMQLSVKPQPEGLRDTLLLEPLENELEPYRQLTFRMQLNGQTQWVSLSKALLETYEVQRLILLLLVGVLGTLLLGVVLLNRWLTHRLWAPFEQTLHQLQGYDIRQHQVLQLPVTRIEEFAQLNHTITQLSKRVAADYATLKEFTENAAHETRTPLAIMQAKLEQLLQLPDLPAPAGPLVGDLYAAVQRLARLHQGLTLLSKIENQQFAAAQPLPLAGLLREKLGQLEEFVQQKDLQLDVQISAEPVLLMHPALVDSLLSNLLHNAIRHNQPGGLLRVQLSATELMITNAGPALAAQQEPAQFFERFRKQNAASESPGLGLSIVQSITAFYGFTVTYAYAPDPPRHTLRVRFGPAASRP
ncbi:sensor histidine kinase [Hymenobacter guriensis]|uniref:histidine kinase n=1 Tax=Hymenobacter guriensis TaxID=2793065 RepID=A0ABS0L7M2_9BACT|nr:HAMP domain-containing sensor histidine kinase [Hymenobacter guriensis]MBG8556130.1 HAMP domain-containing histidine kinase [Hymenobacter guriensis]